MLADYMGVQKGACVPGVPCGAGSGRRDRCVGWVGRACMITESAARFAGRWRGEGGFIFF